MLDLGGGLYVFAPPCRVHDVRVAARELERQRSLLGDGTKVVAWLTLADQRADRPVAHDHGHDDARRQLRRTDLLQCRKPLERDLRSDPDRRLDRSGNATPSPASLIRQDPSMSMTYTPTLQPDTSSADAAIRPGSAAGDSWNRPTASVWLTPRIVPITAGPHTWNALPVAEVKAAGVGEKTRRRWLKLPAERVGRVGRAHAGGPPGQASGTIHTTMAMKWLAAAATTRPWNTACAGEESVVSAYSVCLTCLGLRGGPTPGRGPRAATSWRADAHRLRRTLAVEFGERLRRRHPGGGP